MKTPSPAPSLIWIVATALLGACAEVPVAEPEADAAARFRSVDRPDIYSLVIRRLDAGQSVPDFEDARDDAIDRLESVRGVLAAREFAAFFDFSTFGAPNPPVFSGLAQYDSNGAFVRASLKTLASPEGRAFRQTFEREAVAAVRPLDGDPVDLTTIADGPGELLEIAVRDLSLYPSFDAVDYETSRDAFLDLLSTQPGFVDEFQWVGAFDQDIAVGMTVYESADAFFTIGADPVFNGDPRTAAFLGTYPPELGFVHQVVR